MIEDIDKKVRLLEDQLLTYKVTNESYQKYLIQLEDENKTHWSSIQNSVDAVQLIENIALQERSATKSKMESVISESLKNVYGDEYAVEFDYRIKNNRTSVEVYMVRTIKDYQIKRTIEGHGGGVADAIALPLKIMVLMATPNATKVLFTDEPGKHLDVSYGGVDRFFKFIHDISHKLNLQIILSSHHEAAIDNADVAYEILLKGSESVSKRIL